MKTIPLSSISLQDLILQKQKEKGLSKAQLVQSIGYTRNITKGVRRLNHFMTTLNAPSDDFIINLLNTLDINGLDFSRALNASIDHMNKEAEEHAKSRFVPHVIILRDKNITPRFFDEMITQQHTVIIPEEIQALPFIEEIHELFKIYNNFKDKVSYSKDSTVLHSSRAGLIYQ